MPILDRTDTGAIARLTLNAPEKLNALSDAMLAALQSEFDTLATQSHIRVVILSGAGKAFCAGHDLKEMTAGRQAPDGGKAYFADLFTRCARVMTTDPHPAPAGHRPTPRHRHRRWLPTGGLLRSGRGRAWHPLWRQRRQYRPVLLHSDGGAVAQYPAQTGVRDADHR